jgi:hypothetical protein
VNTKLCSDRAGCIYTVEDLHHMVIIQSVEAHVEAELIASGLTHVYVLFSGGDSVTWSVLMCGFASKLSLFAICALGEYLCISARTYMHVHVCLCVCM